MMNPITTLAADVGPDAIEFTDIPKAGARSISLPAASGAGPRRLSTAQSCRTPNSKSNRHSIITFNDTDGKFKSELSAYEVPFSCIQINMGI